LSKLKAHIHYHSQDAFVVCSVQRPVALL
jgi:hypothetical protein